MSNVLRLAHAEVDLGTAVVRRPGAPPLDLTPLEVRLLRYLRANADRVVSVEELLVSVWGYRAGVRSRAATFTVNRLRAKIELDKSDPVHLLTVRGFGFRFQAPDPMPEGWMGSVESLDAFADQLRKVKRVVVVGRAGVGKTAFVSAWAQRCVEELCTVSLSGVEDEDSWLEAVGAALGVPADVADLRTCVHTALSENLATLVLEDVEPIGDSLGPWVMDCPCRVVVTSRVPVRLLESWTVEPLPIAVATQLFTLLAREHEPDWPNDANAVRRIVERLDGLPLAIELTAASARWFQPTELATRLEDHLGVHDVENTLARSVSWSISLLTPGQRRLVGWMSVLADRVSLLQLERLVSHETGMLEANPLAPALDSLERHGLVVVGERPARVRLAVGVRAAAASVLDDSGEREAAESAHRRWSESEPVVLVPELLAVHERERLRAPGAAQSALRRALPSLPATRTARFIEKRIRQTIERVDSVDPSVRAYFGWCLWKRNQPDAAIHTLKDAMESAGDDAVAMAQALSFSGAVLQMTGQLDLALERIQAAVETLRAAGATGALGRALNALAICRARKGQFSTAKDHVFDGLEVGGDEADTRAILLNTLGNLYLQEGRLQEAVRSYEQSLRSLSSLSNPCTGAPSEAVVGANLAAVQLSLGRLDDAGERYEAAAEAHRRAGHRRGLALAMAGVGRVHLLLDRPADAIEAFLAAVSGLEAVSDRLRASWTRAFLVAALFDEGRVEEAARSRRILQEHEVATGESVGEALEGLMVFHRTHFLFRSGEADKTALEGALGRLTRAAHPELTPMVERGRRILDQAQ